MFQRQLLKLLEQLSISSLDESESFSKIDQNNWHKQSISTEFFLKMFLKKEVQRSTNIAFVKHEVANKGC